MALSENIEIADCLDYASGTSSRDGTSVDMQNWEGVMFICKHATIASSASGDLHLETSSDDSSFNDLEGTKIAVADDDDDEVFVLDLFRPQERYVRPVVTKDGSNAQAETVVAVKYRGRKVPVTDAGADEYELHISPDEGTK